MNARQFRRCLAALLALILLAPALPVGALALSSRDPLLFADLSRAEFEFSYTPFANSEYALYLFSADGGEVLGRAELMLGGEVIASGEGAGELFSCWLVADAQYTIRVRGSGKAVIEVGRNTLSRCMNQALEAREDAVQGKIIAREYDAHWYRFTAGASTLLMLTCMPEERDLCLSARLFDGEGTLISAFNELPGGACMLLAETRAGQDYYLRVCAPSGGTGYYSLNLTRSSGPEFAQALRFNAQQYSLALEDEINLASFVSGEPLLWVSDDPEVALVRQDGSVRGVGEGSARITAHGMSSSAVCTVQVERVPLEGLEITDETITLAVGDTLNIPLRLTPENASEPRLRYLLEDGSIAGVNRSGVLQALREGQTTLTVRSADGALSDSAQLIVVPAQTRYRALLIGEQNYPFSENSHRTGSENSVNAVRSLLETADFDGAAFDVRTASDLSRAELIAEIRSAFAGSGDQDVSLLYITCHDHYEGGMSFLELSDGSNLSARDLERELRAIPGKIIVMIDCCGSGGVIGAASDYLAFADGVTGAFSGAVIRGSKYKVIASAGLDQDSFRIAFNENADSGVMATVFARALCDGGGWSIDRGVRKAMDADHNYDGSVTMDELCQYMIHRVNWYLEIASGLTGTPYRQSVQVYPEGDPFVLLKR